MEPSVNDDRRKDLQHNTAILDVVRLNIADIAEQEREARARLPEEFADTDRAKSMESAIHSLALAKSSLGEAQEHITDAIGA